MHTVAQRHRLGTRRFRTLSPQCCSGRLRPPPAPDGPGGVRPESHDLNREDRARQPDPAPIAPSPHQLILTPRGAPAGRTPLADRREDERASSSWAVPHEDSESQMIPLRRVASKVKT
ncbi:hypothetical protein EVAR_92593_1 [Eumeta japonica]|uniref:Uncharacterized protein n=1 Tax=Eumeta variegata TaxID=151549 RepID=A0A4C1T024_EUMVA|nr:hypothetical protein EVAR_92593_1 [Eumeta japonica]